eukprot:14581259-Heterocapsa_arctica.AAC.1
MKGDKDFMKEKSNNQEMDKAIRNKLNGKFEEQMIHYQKYDWEKNLKDELHNMLGNQIFEFK